MRVITRFWQQPIQTGHSVVPHLRSLSLRPHTTSILNACSLQRYRSVSFVLLLLYKGVQQQSLITQFTYFIVTRLSDTTSVILPSKVSTQKVRMRKRKATDDEWELHKDVILDLYISQDKPLKEVMTAMETQGFRRTQAYTIQLRISSDLLKQQAAI
jgi:hypothetical protein